jgi:hypothetical protein
LTASTRPINCGAALVATGAAAMFEGRIEAD